MTTPKRLQRLQRLRTEALAPRSRYSHLAKADIIDAVKRGCVTQDEAKQAHRLSDAEWQEWIDKYRRDGLEGLRARRRPGRAA